MKSNLTEKELVIQNLKNLFGTDEVSYNGSNRFVVRQKYSVDTSEGGTIFLFKDKLFDENCQEIELSGEYNNIFTFVGDVAPVCIRENIQLKGDRVSQHRKNGLIHKNGKELLPCIYDNVKINHPECSIELTKGDIVKLSSVDEIIAGNFHWDEAADVS